MLIIQPGTFINKTYLHIFELLPQCISEVTNFQHLQMSWMIQRKDWHLKFMVITIIIVHIELHAGFYCVDNNI